MAKENLSNNERRGLISAAQEIRKHGYEEGVLDALRHFQRLHTWVCHSDTERHLLRKWAQNELKAVDVKFPFAKMKGV